MFQTTLREWISRFFIELLRKCESYEIVHAARDTKATPHGTGRTFDWLKHLTGYFVHKGPCNILALCPLNFEWQARLNFCTIIVVPCESTPKRANFLIGGKLSVFTLNSLISVNRTVKIVSWWEFFVTWTWVNWSTKMNRCSWVWSTIYSQALLLTKLVTRILNKLLLIAWRRRDL